MDETEFALQLLMLTAPALLSPQDVVWGFLAVCIEVRTNFGNAADELLTYFEDIYVGRFYHNAQINNP